MILPFLDAEPLYRQYRFDEPWDGPHNSQLADQIPPAYRCPSFAKYHWRHNLETAESKRLTNYVAVSSQRGIFRGPQPTAIAEVRDGTGNTLLVAETRSHSVHWMQPDDASESAILYDLQTAAHEHHANHLGGLQIVLADGSVHFLNSGLSPDTLHALVTRNGGEAPGDF